MPRRSGVLAAVVLLSACGTPDEAPPAPTSTASAPVSATSPASDTSAGSGPVVSSGTASAESRAVTEAPPSDVVPTTVSPEPAAPASEPTAPASQPPVEQAPPPAATVTAAPTAFPDPEQVEAQGVATNPLCEVLAVDEVGALLGEPVKAAQDAASGTGCLWSASSASDGSFLQLQMLGDPAQYVQPDGAEVLTGIGDAAFVVGVDGTWTAQAQNPDGTFAVQLGGSTATRDGAVTGLQRLLERY